MKFAARHQFAANRIFPRSCRNRRMNLSKGDGSVLPPRAMGVFGVSSVTTGLRATLIAVPYGLQRISG